MDQIAPPPYSETDIFSNTNTTILTPTTTESDNASGVAGRLRSNSSSTENSLIYTPYSQTEPDHQRFGNSFGHHFAHDYFESRPIPRHFSAQSISQHNIHVTTRSTPDDIPIPPSAPNYRFTQQDWSTFLNYLLPDHTSNVNNDVADRKLKAEFIDGEIQRLRLNENDHFRVDIDQVQAQLSPLRQSIASPNADWAKRVDEMITVWNEGFFVPRGLKIVRIDMGNPEFEERTNSMPGAWTTDEEEPSNFPGRSKARRCMFRRRSPRHKQTQGFRIGTVVANDEGFTIGKNGLVASSNGFSVGNMFVVDNKGLRVGGRRGFRADEHGVSMGGCRFRGRRGLYSYHERHGRNVRSHCSSSSSSSSSTSNSDVSVRSLPDYKNLKGQQLSAAKDTLTAWLNHPEYPMTTSTVRKMKQDIKHAKEDSKFNKPTSGEDLASLRKEVKELLKRFKHEKKSQNKAEKIIRKEQRGLIKAHRKERKNMRKAERMAKKEDRKKWKREDPPSDFAGPIPSVTQPSLPEIPSVRHPPLPGTTKHPSYISAFEAQNPSMTAIHESWPFFPSLHPQAQARISNHNLPSSILGSTHSFSQTVSTTHSQAYTLLARADAKEVQAMSLQIALNNNGDNRSTVENISTVEEREEETQRKKEGWQEMHILKGEAAESRREGERLLAEVVRMDEEFARQAHEEEVQVKGYTRREVGAIERQT
ncbi:hypothetical protein MFRU_016g01760 [Monilinia fructicola]|nr:hypothetical protein MFRU_016g01760 [Monilinia fructicola]